MYFSCLLIVLSLLSSTILKINAAEEFNYNNDGQEVWSDNYPSCSGRSQSPINIQTACTTYQQFPLLQFSTSYNDNQVFTLKNNGHSISGTLQTGSNTVLSISGGGLNGTFQFANFHLHWGENRKSASEHEVNGVKYSGEIHLVHQNPLTSEYAVLGIFMDSSWDKGGAINNLNLNQDGTTSSWKNYFDIAPKLTEENQFENVNLNLATLIRGNRNDYWRYRGSLTTPPCTEGIIWTVFKEPIYFTETEIKNLRLQVLAKNAREPQPSYNRTVYRSFLNETLSSVPDENFCVTKTLNAAFGTTSFTVNEARFIQSSALRKRRRRQAVSSESSSSESHSDDDYKQQEKINDKEQSNIQSKQPSNSLPI
ncbi:unnamed protein product [Rotaria sp. Silwood2]|nr:unnamed protein product [Rotaria sp. Silwood2]